MGHRQLMDNQYATAMVTCFDLHIISISPAWLCQCSTKCKGQGGVDGGELRGGEAGVKLAGI